MGSVNPAILLTYVALKKDIRNFGKGNPGSMNVFLNVSKAGGIFVFLLDAAKGFLPMWLAESAGFSGKIIAFIGTFVIIGHDFPLFHNLRGGGGIASIIGGLFFLAPVQLSVVLFAILPLILFCSIVRVKLPFFILGLALMTFVLFVSKEYVARAYMMLSTPVVVLRKFDDVLDVFRGRHSKA